ncbi:hypothetical protein KQX54_013755 [Cotesia glomerata]|uniref:Uncharacterized protein n=1 Tax=Cotesia glomerata TaxID=32391 RepID=A0AAV7I615_COTGL|nr:hypothetical protein KQX54_013755 [Cotesia glomerata]
MLTCPKTGKLLGPRGEKNLYQILPGPEKQPISVLCTFSADACGIYSFNPKIIDYSKCISTRREDLSDDYTTYVNSQNLTNNYNTECLKIIESSMPADLLNEFKQAYDRHENPSSEELLYSILKKLNVTVEEYAIEEPAIEDPTIDDANITAEKEDDNLDPIILPNTVSNITLDNLASESLEYDATNLNDQTSNDFSDHDDDNNINDYINYSSKSFEKSVILESTVNNSQIYLDDIEILESTVNNSQIYLDNTVILELENDDNNLLLISYC